VLFINDDVSAHAGVCNIACLRAAKLVVGQLYAVRDVFARQDLADVTLTADGLTSPTVVPPDAGSVLLMLTPK
jgi:hypothetical protein